MGDYFLNFDNHLQNFIWEMYNFDYFVAHKIWPEEDFNHSSSEGPQNHFWNKFLECERAPLLFYSRLDYVNRKKLYDYIMEQREHYMNIL